jgi:hypothetical protein
MDSVRTDLPTEAARERRKKRHSGSKGWRKRCVNHRSGKKILEARMQEEIRRQVQIAVSASK